jgi:hypothetical protein
MDLAASAASAAAASAAASAAAAAASAAARDEGAPPLEREAQELLARSCRLVGVRVPGAGDCQFHALARHLNLCFRRARVAASFDAAFVRARVVEQLARRDAGGGYPMRPFVVAEEYDAARVPRGDFAAFVRHVAQPGSWGSHVTLQAALVAFAALARQFGLPAASLAPPRIVRLQPAGTEVYGALGSISAAHLGAAQARLDERRREAPAARLELVDMQVGNFGGAPAAGAASALVLRDENHYDFACADWLLRPPFFAGAPHDGGGGGGAGLIAAADDDFDDHDDAALMSSPEPGPEAAEDYELEHALAASEADGVERRELARVVAASAAAERARERAEAERRLRARAASGAGAGAGAGRRSASAAAGGGGAGSPVLAWHRTFERLAAAGSLPGLPLPAASAAQQQEQRAPAAYDALPFASPPPPRPPATAQKQGFGLGSAMARGGLSSLRKAPSGAPAPSAGADVWPMEEERASARLWPAQEERSAAAGPLGLGGGGGGRWEGSAAAHHLPLHGSFAAAAPAMAEAPPRPPPPPPPPAAEPPPARAAGTPALQRRGGVQGVVGAGQGGAAGGVLKARRARNMCCELLARLCSF